MIKIQIIRETELELFISNLIYLLFLIITL